MKNFVVTGAVALIALTAGMPALAADAEGEAGAYIVAPLEIERVNDLYFGAIAASATQSDKVVVAPDGSRQCGPALTCLTADHTAAEFGVTGESSAFYTIDLPNEITIASSTGATMKVLEVTGSKSEGQLLSGQDSFTVGGTLEVGAQQEPGLYTGAFTVAVEYQ
ncbi:MAG: DUF4402 domain-containing protein [Erythrobacter sp.]|jgi:hypothetical protein|nr:DUF4402 domain-containing protein [Erythrobacter sp.]